MIWLVLLVAHPLLVVAALRPGVARSRRQLAAALAIAIPIAGPLLALLVRRARGRGAARDPEADAPEPRRVCAADARRVGELPPMLERLLSADPEERLAALVKLAGTADAAAVAVLRWAVEHGSPEVVLDAALTLEELDLRREARLAEARRAFAAAPSFERALATAEAAASGVLSGAADGASVGAMADQARAAYLLALSLEPERWPEIAERWARVELAAARPAAALQVLSWLAAGLGEEDSSRLQPLYEQAAFAARRFELLESPPGSGSKGPRGGWVC